MPGLVPGIHVLLHVELRKDVDGRDKPGHDDKLHNGISDHRAMAAMASVERLASSACKVVIVE
jgi:hypothetical protein